MEYKHSEITEQIIQAFYQVYNNLGYGFLEKIVTAQPSRERTRKKGLRGYKKSIEKRWHWNYQLWDSKS